MFFSALLLAAPRPAIAQQSWEDALRHLGADEIRAGLVIDQIELYDRLPVTHLGSYDLANLGTVSFDVLFRSPDLGIFEWLGSPRPTIGVHLNLADRESMAHAALNWRFEAPGEPDAHLKLFAEIEAGVSIHNGYLHSPPPGYRKLGCRVLGYYGYGVGVQFDDRDSLLLQLQHGSHLGVCGWANNDGLNYAGLKYSHKL